MKLAVILPTRGKPDICACTLRAFDHLSSGVNEIQYFVRIDFDEVGMYDNVMNLQNDKLHCLVLPAPITPASKTLSVIDSKPFKDLSRYSCGNVGRCSAADVSLGFSDCLRA